MNAKMTSLMISFYTLVLFQAILLKEVQSNRFLTYNVNSCPQTDIEWMKASDRLNCSLHFNKKVFRYHCLPESNLTTLVEFCYDQIRPLVDKGNCVVLNGFNKLLDTYNCSKFKDGCPDQHYDSDDVSKYPSCLAIDTEKQCFIAEEKCTTVSRKEDNKIGNICLAAIVVSTLLLTFCVISLLIYMYQRSKKLPTVSDDENVILLDHLSFKDTSRKELKVLYGETVCLTNVVIEKNKRTVNVENCLNFIWKRRKNGKETKYEEIVIDDKNKERLTICNDPSTPMLTIGRAREEDEGDYKLILMNKSEEKIAEADFTLVVLGFKPFVKILGGALVKKGNTASFVVLQSSYPEAFRIKWYKVKMMPDCEAERSRELIDINSDKYKGSTLDFLVINNASSEDQSRYVVEVENVIGKGSQKIDLSLEGGNDIDNDTDDRQLKKEGKEEATLKKQTDRIQNKVEKDIISVSNVRRVYHISDAGSGNFWISDGGRLMKIDGQGFLIQIEEVGRFNTGCHSVTKNGKLLYLKDENVLKCNNEVLIDREKKRDPWVAWCIHSSSINDDILVGLHEKRGTKGKIERYNVKGKHLKSFGEKILCKPLYITENNNKDVIVSDAGKRLVIGMDSKGTKRFYYDENSPTKIFPTGVCTDRKSNILVCIYGNNESNVHLLNKEGNILKKMLSKEDCAGGPFAICIINNKLYLGQESCQNIQVYDHENTSSDENLHDVD